MMPGMALSFAPLILLASAMPALASDPSRDEAAYHDCYRQVLAQPSYGAMTPEQLDSVRETIADAVIVQCDRFLASRRREVGETVHRSARAAGARSNDPFTMALTQGLSGFALRSRVASDLDAIEPRMQGLVEARLLARAAEAERLEADHAGEAADAELLDGKGRINIMNGEEAYTHCLTRNLVRVSRTGASEGDASGLALRACADMRSSLIRLVEEDRPSLVLNLEGAERRLREDGPTLVHALRAARPAASTQE